MVLKNKRITVFEEIEKNKKAEVNIEKLKRITDGW